MSPSRIRSVSVLVLLALNALVVLTWSQTWVDARSEGEPLPIPGSAAGGAELPLALTGLVLVAALLIAGRVFRVILPVLQALLGACVAIAAALVLADPVSAARPEVARATGITGSDTAVDAVATGWPTAALVLGILLVLAGIGVAATVGRWPRPTSRFDRTRAESAEGHASGGVDGSPTGRRDAVDEWDALSDGEDPTRPAG